MSARAFSVHGSFDIDARNAFSEITRLRDAAREAARDLKEIQKNGKLDFRTSGAAANLKEVGEAAKKTGAASRDAAKAARESLGQQKRDAADWARQLEAENKRAGVSVNRFGDVVKNATRDQREALSKQKNDGASWAREIDKTYNRSGVTINRFGEQVKTVSGRLDEMSQQQRAAFAVQKNAAEEWARAIETEMKRAGTSVDRYGEQVQDAQREAREQAQAAAAEAKVGSAREKITESLSNTAGVGGLAIFAGLGASVNEAVKWQDAFAGVAKTVDATDKQLGDLSKSLRQMATEIPVSADELATIAENAGQLGIQTKSIKSFTRVMADLSVATNMTADQASTDLAKIANITKMPQEQFDRLGATLVDLGNKGASTESDIVAMAQRIAGAGNQVGLTLPQILAFSSSLSSVGIEAEAGGSAISAAFVKIDMAVRKGGDELKLYAKTAGVSAADFKKAYEQDAAGAMTKFLEGLARMKKQGGDVFGTLDDLGLSAIRTRDAMLRLSGNTDLLKASLKDADAAWKSNTALTTEASKRYTTAASRVKIAQNEMRELGITVGETLVPALNDTLKATSGVFKWFKDLSPETQKNIVKTIVLVGALGLLTKGVVSTIGAVKVLTEAFPFLATRGKAAFAGIRTAAVFSATATKTAWLASLGGMRTAMVAFRAFAATTFGAVGIALAAVVAIVWGFKTAFLGAQDAGTMAADKLIEKWGVLGKIWANMGDGLGGLLVKLNGADAANGEAERKLQALNAGSQKRKFSSLGKSAGFGAVDGSHADGLKYVPKDGYIAELHRGERVLTAQEAASLHARSGGSSGSSGTSGTSDAAAANISNSMMLQIAKSFSKGEPYYSCAFVASRLANAVGANINTTASAGQLRQNAIKAGWTRVNRNDMQRGDLIFNPRNGGSGWHVKTGANNGMVVNSNHKQETMYRYRPKAHDEVYRAPGGARGGSLSLGQYSNVETEAARAEKERLAAIHRRNAASNADAASIRERNNLLKYESGLLKNSALSMEDVNARLEDETNRRKRVKDLIESGYTKTQAEQIAKVRMAQEGSNRSLEKSNDLQKAAREKTQELIQAGEERMKNYAGEVAAQREQATALLREGALLSDNALTLDDVNQKLENEAYLRERVAHWVEQGYSKTQAGWLADQDAAQERSNKSLARNNELLRQQRQAALDAADAAGAAMQQLKDESVKAQFEAINTLMGDTQLSAEKVAQTLGNVADRIARGELLPGAMPDKAKISQMMGIGNQNDVKGMLDDLGSRIGGESDNATSALFAQFDSNRSPLDIAGDKVQQLRLDLGDLRKVAEARGVDMSGYTKNFEYWEKVLDNIVPNLKKAQELAGLDSLQKQLAAEGLNYKLRELEVAGQLTDVKRLELTWASDNKTVSAEELALRKQILDTMEETSRLKPPDTRVVDYLRDVGDRTSLIKIQNPLEQSLEGVRQAKRRDGWSEEDIQKIIPAARVGLKAEEMAGRVRSAMDGMKSDMGNLWGNLRDKGISSFGDLFGGILNQFYSFADQMLTNAVWGQVEGLLGGLVGGLGGGGAASIGAGAFTPAFAPTALSGAVSGAKLNFGGAFASGLDAVPNDGFVGVLHKGEAVLNAQAATQWRNQQRMMNASAGASSGAAMPPGGGGSTASPNIIVQGDLIVKDARSPQGTARRIYGAARSRSETRRSAVMALTGGG